MKAVIIDDEPNAVELLILRLEQCCPQMEVAEGCTSSVKGVEKQLPTQKEQVQHLKAQMEQTTGKPLPGKIALPYQNGVTFVELKDVIYYGSDSSYTTFHLTDGQHYLVTKPLREIQELLEERGFLRIHRQYVINLDHIKKFIKGEGSYLVLTNGQSIPVSRQHRERLIAQFGWL